MSESTEIVNYVTKSYLAQEYIAEWEVDKLSKLGTKSIRTPIFCPVPNVNIKFCFELWYQIIKMAKKERDVSCFKLVLLKLEDCDTPSLKLKIDVSVNYSDNSVYKEYSSPISISVENIDTVVCADATSEFYNYSGGYYNEAVHKKRMVSDKLFIKFHTKFYGHLSSPAEYHRKMDKLDNLKSFVKDFKSIYISKAFSDVVFEIGRKKLPAHKSVLAAHSPVFLKMLEDDFEESRTNTITIRDYGCETFENFLRYLYTGEIEDKTWISMKDLYILSDKYAIIALKQDCADIIASNINIDQVCEVLEMAYFYDDQKLKCEASNFALQHFDELVSTEKWAELVTNDPLIGYELLRLHNDVNSPKK
ncbi:uncharacterized protein [Parasteatoda tepidariorum]|uniref:uncharacterized protein n=1 Tax=Parasteatoda tepidariorum TaxID=114398 RepID=UPI00077FE4E1|nr:BTB/POZ domain-containing protein At4g08455-like [Parasteatoda tepidariorum]